MREMPQLVESINSQMTKMYEVKWERIIRKFST